MPENPMGLSPPTPLVTCSLTNTTPCSTSSVFASIFASSTISQTVPSSPFPNMMNTISCLDGSTSSIEPTSLSLYLPTNFEQETHHHFAPSTHPALSATALLQKAAQVGASSSSTNSLLHGLSLALSSSTSSIQDSAVKLESGNSMGLGLGLHSGDVMMGSSSLFGNKPTTLDLFGLGFGGAAGGGPTGGLSALLNSFGSGGGGFNVGPAPYGGGSTS